jgi:hypothetical protein
LIDEVKVYAETESPRYTREEQYERCVATFGPVFGSMYASKDGGWKFRMNRSGANIPGDASRRKGTVYAGLGLPVVEQRLDGKRVASTLDVKYTPDGRMGVLFGSNLPSIIHPGEEGTWLRAGQVVQAVRHSISVRKQLFGLTARDFYNWEYMELCWQVRSNNAMSRAIGTALVRANPGRLGWVAHSHHSANASNSGVYVKVYHKGLQLMGRPRTSSRYVAQDDCDDLRDLLRMEVSLSGKSDAQQALARAILNPLTGDLDTGLWRDTFCANMPESVPSEEPRISLADYDRIHAEYGPATACAIVGLLNNPIDFEYTSQKVHDTPKSGYYELFQIMEKERQRSNFEGGEIRLIPPDGDAFRAIITASPDIRAAVSPN